MSTVIGSAMMVVGKTPHRHQILGFRSVLRGCKMSPPLLSTLSWVFGDESDPIRRQNRTIEPNDELDSPTHSLFSFFGTIQRWVRALRSPNRLGKNERQKEKEQTREKTKTKSPIKRQTSTSFDHERDHDQSSIAARPPLSSLALTATVCLASSSARCTAGALTRSMPVLMSLRARTLSFFFLSFMRLS